MRASVGLSFNDEESFKEAAGSLKFYNPPSDTSSLQGMGSSTGSSMLPRERYEDISSCFDNPPSDPNIILQVPVENSGSGSTPSQELERSEDT